MWIGVVVGIPDSYSAELTQARRAAGDPLALHIPPHVTLLPPIEVGAGVVDQVRTHLARVASEHTPFEMTLAGTETFRPVSPVVYVAVARGWDECVSLQSHVNSGVLETELQFPYHPHVTIAQSVPEPALDQAQDSMGGFEASFIVSSIDLYSWNGEGYWERATSFPLTLGT